MSLIKRRLIYESDNFIIRLVNEDDASGLLKCYSDINARPFFNSDKCTSDFYFNTLDEINNCIKMWIGCYKRQEFIRFAIVAKLTMTAVGTIEMFGNIGAYKVKRGILRVDICSEYENEAYLSEIVGLCVENFYDAFDVDFILIKAISQAINRISSLKSFGFIEYEFPDRENYFILSKNI